MTSLLRYKAQRTPVFLLKNSTAPPAADAAPIQLIVNHLELDFHINAGRKLKTHERIDGLRRRVVHIDQSVVRARLKVFPAILFTARRKTQKRRRLVGNGTGRCAPPSTWPPR